MRTVCIQRQTFSFQAVEHINRKSTAKCGHSRGLVANNMDWMVGTVDLRIGHQLQVPARKTKGIFPPGHSYREAADDARSWTASIRRRLNSICRIKRASRTIFSKRLDPMLSAAELPCKKFLIRCILWHHAVKRSVSVEESFVTLE